MPDPRHVVIMGAGPAGLTAAYELDKRGIRVTVLEKDPVYVGGIARTVEHNGYRFDIGGHRFFSKSQEIEDLWTEILGAEMLTRDRLSRIYYRGKFFDYPLRAANALINLGLAETVLCMASYAQARIRPIRPARTVEDWVTNQFGRRLFEMFFKTYTEKVWGISTSDLSADWAAQRIRGLDLQQAIKNALLPKRTGERGAVIKTLIDRFRYPRLGPGQMWDQVRDVLRQHGQEVRLGAEVEAICHAGGRVTAVEAGDRVAGDEFISTLPIHDLVGRLQPPAPAPVRRAAESLRYRDFVTVALVIDRAEIFPDNWVYIHDPSVRVGRLQNFKNWSPGMVADPGKTCIGLEYFCFEGDGLWTSSDDQLIALATRELGALGMCRREEVIDGAVVRVQKAYPVYDDEYLGHVATVRDWIHRELPNLHLAGRNGMHKYNNQDHSMMTALIVARNIAAGAGLDPWKVNTDAEYHEEARADGDMSGRAVPTRV
jgi:protoporphyrinogen oxidase